MLRILKVGGMFAAWCSIIALDLGSLTAPGGAELPPIMLPRIKLLRRSIAMFFGGCYLKSVYYSDWSLLLVFRSRYVLSLRGGVDVVARSFNFGAPQNDASKYALVPKRRPTTDFPSALHLVSSWTCFQCSTFLLLHSSHDSCSTHQSCGKRTFSHDFFCPRRRAARCAKWHRQKDSCVLLRFGCGQLCLCCRTSYETAPNSNGPQPDYELWSVQEDGNLRKSNTAVQSALPSPSLRNIRGYCADVLPCHERCRNCLYPQIADFRRSVPNQRPTLKWLNSTQMNTLISLKRWRQIIWRHTRKSKAVSTWAMTAQSLTACSNFAVSVQAAAWKVLQGWIAANATLRSTGQVGFITQKRAKPVASAILMVCTTISTSGQCWLLFFRHRSWNPRTSPLQPACTLYRYRRASWWWGWRSLLHDRPSYDRLIPQIWWILSWYRRTSRHWCWSRKELFRQLPLTRRYWWQVIQSHIWACYQERHGVLSTWGNRATMWGWQPVRGSSWVLQP